MRLGRRGGFLLAVGLAWVCYGASFLFTQTPAAQREGLRILTSAVPLDLLGWLWIASGAVGIAFCAVRRVGADQFGFTALVVPSALWAASYLTDWIVVGDYARGWVVASTHAATAASIVIASGWAEVQRE